MIGLVDGLGHEAERALRSNHQPTQDFDWRFTIEKSMHGISASVTDAILPDNSGRELLVRKNLPADLRQARRHFWLGCSKTFLSVRVLGIDDRAGRKYDFHSDDRMV